MKNRYNINRHSAPESMVVEALEQNLMAVELALKHKARVVSANSNAYGILGYPSAILMFSIIDTIGSHFRKSKVQPYILLDNTSVRITASGDQHFYILNSEYFDLKLTKDNIKAFYKIGRNTLNHNSLIGEELTLVASYNTPFLKVNDVSGKGKYEVHLFSFYEACVSAIEKFKLNKDEILANSIYGKTFPKTKRDDNN